MFLVIPLASAALGGAAAKAQQIIRTKRGPKATSESLKEEIINKTAELDKRSKVSRKCSQVQDGGRSRALSAHRN